jgi:hypothetical protein
MNINCISIPEAKAVQHEENSMPETTTGSHEYK